MGTIISIQSAGRRSDQDYSWSTEKDKALNASDDLRSSFALLDDDPSLLVERREKGFFVLLAGFSSNRFDYRDRTIRNAVAWDGLEENEATRVAILFLRDCTELQKEFDKAIRASETTPSGYEVDWDDLGSIPGNLKIAEKSSNGDSARYELPWSKASELADELESSGWPAALGLLLVATKLPLPNAEREILRRNVWRFLHECDSKKILIIQEEPQDPKAQAGLGSGFPNPLVILVLLSVITLLMVVKWPRTQKPSSSPNFRALLRRRRRA